MKHAIVPKPRNPDIPCCVLGIDVETLGPNLWMNPLVQVGFAVLDKPTGNLIAAHSFYVNRRRKLADPACINDFWLQTNENGEMILNHRLKQVLIESEKAPLDTMEKFTPLVRRATFGMYVDVIVDTSGFDVSWINHYLPLPMNSDSPPSINYITLDPEDNIPIYNPPMDVNAYFKGIGAKYKMSSPYMSACAALDIEPKTFSNIVQYDHDPKNDAWHFALRYCYIERELEKQRQKQKDTATSLV